jgi:hypothetical protein
MNSLRKGHQACLQATESIELRMIQTRTALSGTMPCISLPEQIVEDLAMFFWFIHIKLDLQLQRWAAFCLIGVLITGCSSQIDTRTSTSVPTGPITPHSTVDLVSVHTDRTHYTTTSPKLTITNSTVEEISVPTPDYGMKHGGEATFHVYRKTPMGWKRLQPLPGIIVPPVADSPQLIIPVQGEASIDVGQVFGAYGNEFGIKETITGTFMMQVRYAKHDTEDLLMYTNEFSIGEAASISSTEINVELVPEQPFTFRLRNTSDQAVWYSDTCTNESSSTTLQKLTSDGTWQVVTAICDFTPPLRQLRPSQTLSIDATKPFRSKPDQLASGRYRWDVVIYLYLDSASIPRGEHHIFSEVFEPGKSVTATSSR